MCYNENISLQRNLANTAKPSELFWMTEEHFEHHFVKIEPSRIKPRLIKQRLKDPIERQQQQQMNWLDVIKEKSQNVYERQFKERISN